MTKTNITVTIFFMILATMWLVHSNKRAEYLLHNCTADHETQTLNCK